jgi:hypothetical protein
MTARRAALAATTHRQRSITCAGCLVLLGCEPLIATVGVEQETVGSTDAALLDAGEMPVLPEADAAATEAHDAHVDAGGSTVDAAPPDVITVDRSPKNCIVLPDLMDASDGGTGPIRSVEDGVVWARFDKELGCPNVGNVITYGRVDGKPLILAGVSAAISWPASDRMGPSTLHPTNGPCDPFGIFPLVSVVFAGFTGCHPTVQPAQYLRAQLAFPSVHPFGLTLCENACGH